MNRSEGSSAGRPAEGDATRELSPAAGIVHDLNNSLTMILGLCEWLLATLAPDAAGRSEISSIREAALEAAATASRLSQAGLAGKPVRGPAAKAAAAEERPGPAQPMAVLLVDDQPAVRDSVAAMLATLGHRVTTAESAESALALLEQTFDVVITDFGMPGANGLDLAHAIRERGARLPVLLLTGWGAEVRQSPDIALVVSKPVTIGSLRQALAEVAAA
jgi:CheY-like chemotaxis protein